VSLTIEAGASVPDDDIYVSGASEVWKNPSIEMLVQATPAGNAGVLFFLCKESR